MINFGFISDVIAKLKIPDQVSIPNNAKYNYISYTNNIHTYTPCYTTSMDTFLSSQPLGQGHLNLCHWNDSNLLELNPLENQHKRNKVHTTSPIGQLHCVTTPNPIDSNKKNQSESANKASFRRNLFINFVFVVSI